MHVTSCSSSSAQFIRLELLGDGTKTLPVSVKSYKYSILSNRCPNWLYFSCSQELKSLLLEAQKGPESLQEALRVQAGHHRSQQEELRTIIESLRLTLNDSSALRDQQRAASEGASAPLTAPKDPHLSSRQTQSLLQSLPPQMGRLGQGLNSVQGELSAVRKLLESKQEQIRAGGLLSGEQAESHTLLGRLPDSQRTLGGQLRTNTLYNALFSYTAATLTVCALYLLLRGSG